MNPSEIAFWSTIAVTAPVIGLAAVLAFQTQARTLHRAERWFRIAYAIAVSANVALMLLTELYALLLLTGAVRPAPMTMITAIVVILTLLAITLVPAVVEIWFISRPTGRDFRRQQMRMVVGESDKGDSAGRHH